VTEAHVCEQLAQGRHMKVRGRTRDLLIVRLTPRPNHYITTSQQIVRMTYSTLYLSHTPLLCPRPP